ncbi:MAG TPA: carboxymuconolactone decarboxylase family protein [Acidimicrobiales bacterium]|nr:carboxymuconolactone decarboxylase family protein [Acidimicrobiales bacterium]
MFLNQKRDGGIEPLEPPFAPEVAAELEKMTPPGVPPIALFRTFAKNLPMTRAMRPWGTYELSRALSLSLREREIVIDRTCARCGCEYEWGVHVAFFSVKAELTPAQVTSLTFGTCTDECWQSERERLLIETVDALHDDNDISDDLSARLATALTEEERLDLFLLAGWYHAISFVARAARVSLEEGVARFIDVG